MAAAAAADVAAVAPAAKAAALEMFAVAAVARVSADCAVEWQRNGEGRREEEYCAEWPILSELRPPPQAAMVEGRQRPGHLL